MFNMKKERPERFSKTRQNRKNLSCFHRWNAAKCRIKINKLNKIQYGFTSLSESKIAIKYDSESSDVPTSALIEESSCNY